MFSAYNIQKWLCSGHGSWNWASWLFLVWLPLAQHTLERSSKSLPFSYAKIYQWNVFSWQQSVTVTVKTTFTPWVYFYRFLFLVLLLTLLFSNKVGETFFPTKESHSWKKVRFIVVVWTDPEATKIDLHLLLWFLIFVTAGTVF